MARKSQTTPTPEIIAPAESVPPDVLKLFHSVVAQWFSQCFDGPTAAQQLGWPAIARGESTLILAPTGSGKTLTAFLWCLNQLMFGPRPTEIAPPRRSISKKPKSTGCRVVYVSPLKALAVDIERNLQVPLAGILSLAAQQGIAAHEPQIAVRTGDTPQSQRSKFRRSPAEILITTPESLYLLLTSQAAAGLATVETVIIDEIHALVPTKRGAHLALSLERLEELTGRRLQRIGLSATQRPLEEVARFLGGAERNSPTPEPAFATAAVSEDSATIADELTADNNNLAEAAPDEADTHIKFRPVTIVNAGQRKALALSIEVPVTDMARLSEPDETPDGGPKPTPKRASIWTAMYPHLLEMVRERQSTLIFVNSRRVAERMAAAINDLAGEPLARAHHGSLSAIQRAEIEDLLKAGQIKALVATSSLELGIDMGAIDLVVQIEAPPSVSSGLQRIGRAGHRAGAVSEGVLIPKFRGDLVACAAVTRAMREGLVESSRYLRNPLDVLAQQIVAIVAAPPRALTSHATEDDVTGISADELFSLIRHAAPFAHLSRNVFEGVLDMLAGRYPADEFAELRPRITWDRTHNILTPREGAKSLSILNAGTIPDRGMYGVFLTNARSGSARVGELDEEMVFESRVGDTFLLGATTWRIEEITRDRVEVSPAPGEPGKMPFWHGDLAGRPIEFGQRIGALVRELGELPHNAAISRLVREHDLQPGAAENLLRYLIDQRAATDVVPDDRTIVIESLRDELGDWRVCVLTPFGSRVHAPWAMAVSAHISATGGVAPEILWADDGFVLRFPDMDTPPGAEMLLLNPRVATDLVLRQVGSTALFAAKFREAAARALLLPRHRAQGRAPLWHQRKRASDLLSVASRYPSFPILLETYRECLRDVFDMPAFLATLRAVERREIRVHTVETRTPSPFASSLLFSYVGAYIYEGDAPLAERRAQALAIDQDQLRDLLGDADLRELLDADVIDRIEERLQARAETYRSRNADGVHDLLLRLGDLSDEELLQRSANPEVAASTTQLAISQRALSVTIAGTPRWIAIEDAGKYRDALNIAIPANIPAAFLATVHGAQLELLKRYARTHGPFTSRDAAARFDLPQQDVEGALRKLVDASRILEGDFRPGGVHREWCDADVLRQIRRASLAKLRKQVEPMPQSALARFGTHWQGVLTPRRGLDALLDTLEMLQGLPMPASLVEREILPARVRNFSPADIDRLVSAGELIWVGVSPLGERDGRIAFYLTDHLAELMPPPALRPRPADLSAHEQAIVEGLRRNGASFFAPLHESLGGGYPGETLDALWSLVWRGVVTNDSPHALRAYVTNAAESDRRARRMHSQQNFRSRRTVAPSGEGRWTLLEPPSQTTATSWSHAIANQLLTRYGLLTREQVLAEDLPGGFTSVYGVLKAMEESGRVRRGYFVDGLGATQFAQPAAVELLRSLRRAPDKAEMVMLSALDPANPYGSIIRWPEREPSATDPADAAPPADAPQLLSRSVGARVVLRNGELAAYMRRKNPNLQVFLPADDPDRTQAAQDLALFLAEAELRRMRSGDRRGLLIGTINGGPPSEHTLAPHLMSAGFQPGRLGLVVPRVAGELTPDFDDEELPEVVPAS